MANHLCKHRVNPLRGHGVRAKNRQDHVLDFQEALNAKAQQ
jgi:hypothetical protein